MANNRIRFSLITVILVMLFCTAEFLFAEHPDLKEAVGDDLFSRAGLNKLSTVEQEILVEGLSRIFENGENPFFDPEKSEKRFGFANLLTRRATNAFESEPESIQSRFVGEFRGWEGSTRFVLENGQVWIQSEKGTLYIPKKTNPLMTIKKGVLGVYFISVEGYKKRTKVKRIK
jgi:hypothetical protein